MNKHEATILGKRLLSKMPKGWKLKVDNNMGYYYYVHFGDNISVHPCWDDETFFCLMGDMPNCGRPEWTDKFHSEDPMEVVKHTLNLAKKNVEELQKIVEKVEKSLTK